MKSDIIQFGDFLHKNNFYNLILSWFKKIKITYIGVKIEVYI